MREDGVQEPGAWHDGEAQLRHSGLEGGPEDEAEGSGSVEEKGEDLDCLGAYVEGSKRGGHGGGLRGPVLGLVVRYGPGVLL